MRRIHHIPEPRRRTYRYVFLAAAIYNLIWGVFMIAMPGVGLNWLGVTDASAGAVGQMFWQCIGMFVMVFGIGYWYASREPERFAPFILIGLIGKICGPIGFVVGWWQGLVPGRFGWTLLCNDLAWWPIFVPFVYETIIQRRYEPR